MNLLGDFQVKEVLQEKEEAYLYLIGDENQLTHLVAWRPLNINGSANGDQASWVKFPDYLRQKKIELNPKFYKLDGQIELDEKLRCQNQGKLHSSKNYVNRKRKSIEMKLSAIPYIFPLKE